MVVWSEKYGCREGKDCNNMDKKRSYWGQNGHVVDKCCQIEDKHSSIMVSHTKTCYDLKTDIQKKGFYHGWFSSYCYITQGVGKWIGCLKLLQRYHPA